MAAAIPNNFQTSNIPLFSVNTKPLFGLTIDSKGMQEEVWFMYLSCTSLNQDAKDSEEIKKTWKHYHQRHQVFYSRCNHE